MSIPRSWSLLVWTALATAGCATTSAPPTTTVPRGLGVVTGIASPCWPYATDRGIRRASVTVTLSRDGRTVATQTVRGDHVYRVELVAGAYVVSTPFSRPVPVAVTVGRTVRADLPDDCV